MLVREGVEGGRERIGDPVVEAAGGEVSCCSVVAVVASDSRRDCFFFLNLLGVELRLAYNRPMKQIDPPVGIKKEKIRIQ